MVKPNYSLCNNNNNNDDKVYDNNDGTMTQISRSGSLRGVCGLKIEKTRHLLPGH